MLYILSSHKHPSTDSLFCIIYFPLRWIIFVRIWTCYLKNSLAPIPASTYLLVRAASWKSCLYWCCQFSFPFLLLIHSYHTFLPPMYQNFLTRSFPLVKSNGLFQSLSYLTQSAAHLPRFTVPSWMYFLRLSSRRPRWLFLLSRLY